LVNIEVANDIKIIYICLTGFIVCGITYTDEVNLKINKYKDNITRFDYMIIDKLQETMLKTDPDFSH
jgi:hypothetical protein